MVEFSRQNSFDAIIHMNLPKMLESFYYLWQYFPDFGGQKKLKIMNRSKKIKI